jgi:glycosyltransferase involved in cell wall biosynthesis
MIPKNPLPHSTRRRRLVWVMNIPTPYRVHLFDALTSELDGRHIDFHVYFMAHTRHPRRWVISKDQMPFNHSVAAGIHPRHGSDVFHFNPGIPFAVVKTPPTWLVLGGAWWMPTVVLSLFGANRSVYKILHSEANRYSMRFPSGSVAFARRRVLDHVDAFAVPGRIAQETLTEVCGSSKRPFLLLPNLVDERRFGSEVEKLRGKRDTLRAKFGVARDARVLVWCARLEEGDKGIQLFLKTVHDLVPENVVILIAGEGPDRAAIQELVDRHLAKSVRLLGQKNEQEVLELLAIADAALLPSLRDPNPLSVIEALWAGLPLLLSDRCGNRPEALEQEKNGWSIDPENADVVRNAFRQLLSAGEGELATRGGHSRRIAAERFSTPQTVSRFVDGLERLPLPVETRSRSTLP